MAALLANTGAQEGLAGPTATTNTPSPTAQPSPSQTLTDLHSNGSPDAKKSELPASSTLNKTEADNIAAGKGGFHGSKTAIALSSLPAARKNILLLCFCLAYVPVLLLSPWPEAD
jgi:hypothetical protein